VNKTFSLRSFAGCKYDASGHRCVWVTVRAPNPMQPARIKGWSTKAPKDKRSWGKSYPLSISERTAPFTLNLGKIQMGLMIPVRDQISFRCSMTYEARAAPGNSKKDWRTPLTESAM